MVFFDGKLAPHLQYSLREVNTWSLREVIFYGSICLRSWTEWLLELIKKRKKLHRAEQPIERGKVKEQIRKQLHNENKLRRQTWEISGYRGAQGAWYTQEGVVDDSELLR